VSADDNLRDALIEALKRDGPAHYDGLDELIDDWSDVADIALKVVEDWTADEPRSVAPLGISQLALITQCRIEADAMVARNAMDAACSRVPSYDGHRFFKLAAKLSKLI